MQSKHRRGEKLKALDEAVNAVDDIDDFSLDVDEADTKLSRLFCNVFAAHDTKDSPKQCSSPVVETCHDPREAEERVHDDTCVIHVKFSVTV